MSTEGIPGSWKKYYCASADNCGFTQPGIGGKDSSIAPLFGAAVISFNSYIGKYIAIDTASVRGSQDKPVDIKIQDADDLTKWKRLLKNPPILPAAPTNWDNFYPSIVPLESDLKTGNIAENINMNKTGKQFWLYYVQVGKPRYQFRRLVTLQSNNETAKQGDADGNNEVNKKDFNIWKSNFLLKQSVSITDISKGNFNSDMTIDGLDYAIWFDNFGK